MAKSKSFKSLNLIFNSMIAGQILFGFVVYYLNNENIIDPFLNNFTYLPIVVLVINSFAILTAKYFFTKRTKIDKKQSLEEKINSYTTITIIIFALLEGANIVNLIVFLFNGTIIYLVVAVLILLLFLIYRPSLEKFAQDTLSSDEKILFLE